MLLEKIVFFSTRQVHLLYYSKYIGPNQSIDDNQ